MSFRNVGITATSRIEKLVLIGATARAKEVGELIENEAKITEMNEIHFEFAENFQRSTFANVNEVPEWFVTAMIQAATQNNLLTAWKKGIHYVLCDTPDPLSFCNIKCPTLIIWGDKDELFPKSMQTELLKLIESSQLFVVENGGHSVQWDKPEVVAEAINNFVSGKK